MSPRDDVRGKRPYDKDTYADIPVKLREARRWLLWSAEPGKPGKKPRKVPYYADGGRRSGRLDCPADWARLVTFDEAFAALVTGDYTGMGIALGPDETGNCWQGIDLDDIADHPGLEFVAEDLPGYTEQSPSGRGMHAIGYGRPFPTLGPNGSGIEAYSAGRFFTVTGDKGGLGEITCLADFVSERLVQPHAPDDPPQSPGMGAFQASLLVAELRDALTFISSGDRDIWIRVGMALKGSLGDGGEGLWLEWSKGSEKFDPEDAARVWRTLKPHTIDHRWIFNAARRRGWNGPGGGSDPSATATDAADDGDVAPEFSEEALALTQTKPKPAATKYHFWLGGRVGGRSPKST
jgi:hypothetical protein